jgi:hypothetical protein
MDACMTSQPIPNEDHISRYVSPTRIYESQAGVRRVDDKVFLPRRDYPPGTGPEEYVSVDWMEYFLGDFRTRLDQIRDLLQVRFRRRLPDDSAFATIRVGLVKEVGLKNQRPLVLQTAGNPNDPSHSGIYGLTPEDDIIGKEIANIAEIENIW